MASSSVFKDKAAAAKKEKEKESKRTNCPGARLHHGRIYDSENGKTCHQVFFFFFIIEIELTQLVCFKFCSVDGKMWENEIIALMSSVSCSVWLMRLHGSNILNILVVVFFFISMLRVITHLFFQSFFLFG